MQKISAFSAPVKYFNPLWCKYLIYIHATNKTLRVPKRLSAVYLILVSPYGLKFILSRWQYLMNRNMKTDVPHWNRLKIFSLFFQLNNLSNLIPSLIACELAVDSSSNWRLHVQLLEKFSCFPKCLTSDQIYYKFVPLFFRLLSSNVSFIVQCYLAVGLFNPFNPLSGQHLISP